MPACTAIVTVKMVQFFGVRSCQLKPKGVLRPKRPGKSFVATPSFRQMVSDWFASWLL